MEIYNLDLSYRNIEDNRFGWEMKLLRVIDLLVRIKARDWIKLAKEIFQGEENQIPLKYMQARKIKKRQKSDRKGK